MNNESNAPMSNKTNIHVNFLFKIHIFSQVACGMCFLETKRIVHRDLEARNILINDYHKTKISGFHHARVLEIDEDEYNLQEGNIVNFLWCHFLNLRIIDVSLGKYRKHLKDLKIATNKKQPTGQYEILL